MKSKDDQNIHEAELQKNQYGKCIHAKNILWLLFIFIMVYNIDNCWISSLENIYNGYHNYLPRRQLSGKVD